MALAPGTRPGPNPPHIAAICAIESSTGARICRTASPSIRPGLGASRTESKDGGPLSIAREIVEALEARHEQGIVYRDLKPAHITGRGDGTVKVLDLGPAKSIGPPLDGLRSLFPGGL